MEGRIASMGLVVSNLSKALEFYTETVGFAKKTDFSPTWGSRYVTVGPKHQAMEIQLWQLGSAVAPGQESPSKHWAPGRGPPIVLQVDDCEKAYRELRERGVQFPQPAFRHPWGTSATFQDADGNLFSLNEPVRSDGAEP